VPCSRRLFTSSIKQEEHNDRQTSEQRTDTRPMFYAFGYERGQRDRRRPMQYIAAIESQLLSSADLLHIHRVTVSLRNFVPYLFLKLTDSILFE